MSLTLQAWHEVEVAMPRRKRCFIVSDTPDEKAKALWRKQLSKNCSTMIISLGQFDDALSFGMGGGYSYLVDGRCPGVCQDVKELLPKLKGIAGGGSRVAVICDSSLADFVKKCGRLWVHSDENSEMDHCFEYLRGGE